MLHYFSSVTPQDAHSLHKHIFYIAFRSTWAHKNMYVFMDGLGMTLAL